MAAPNETLTVLSSTASTLVTPWNLAAWAQPAASSEQYFQVKTASAAVTGEPSDQVTSGLIFQVIDMRSAAMPPLSSVGISAAMKGTRLPSWS